MARNGLTRKGSGGSAKHAGYPDKASRIRGFSHHHHQERRSGEEEALEFISVWWVTGKLGRKRMVSLGFDE